MQRFSASLTPEDRKFARPIGRIVLIAYSSTALALTAGVMAHIVLKNPEPPKPPSKLPRSPSDPGGLIMLAQLALLMIFQFIGQAVVTGLGIMFPGPLCGMILLLGYLFARGGPTKELSVVGTTLIDHLGLLFVPAGTAIVAYGALSTRWAGHIRGIVRFDNGRHPCQCGYCRTLVGLR